LNSYITQLDVDRVVLPEKIWRDSGARKNSRVSFRWSSLNQDLESDAGHAEYANGNDPGTRTYMQANRVSHNIILDGKFFILRSASIAIAPSNDDREVSRNDLQNSHTPSLPSSTNR